MVDLPQVPLLNQRHMLVVPQVRRGDGAGGVRLLDLFSGAGGAAAGYYRAGFTEIVGVDNRPMPRYPFHFIQADALEYLAEHGREFDVIHASPPCQKYTTLQNVNSARGIENRHTDLIALTHRALQETGQPYVIENVQGAPLETQIILCGHALGLPQLARHRHFESSALLFAPPCTHRGADNNMIGIYGERPDGHRVSELRYKLTRTASSIDEARRVMGIDWMDWDELKEAVPPAYTEFIGLQLLRALE
jgi:DNA (cytosine-5)-methyltransferase 1